MSRSRNKTRRIRPQPPREGVGGQHELPFFVGEGDEPERPEVAMWLELPSGLIVGQELAMPAESQGGLGRALTAALDEPLIGPRRRPDSIRVADASLVGEVRAVLGPEFPIKVAPAPELEELIGQFAESVAELDEEMSYFEDGQIEAEEVAKLFVAAKLLYEIAPWMAATDDQPVRMDIPTLEVDGACLCVIGREEG